MLLIFATSGPGGTAYAQEPDPDPEAEMPATDATYAEEPILEESPADDVIDDESDDAIPSDPELNPTGTPRAQRAPPRNGNEDTPCSTGGKPVSEHGVPWQAQIYYPNNAPQWAGKISTSAARRQGYFER